MRTSGFNTGTVPQSHECNGLGNASSGTACPIFLSSNLPSLTACSLHSFIWSLELEICFIPKKSCSVAVSDFGNARKGAESSASCNLPSLSMLVPSDFLAAEGKGSPGSPEVGRVGDTAADGSHTSVVQIPGETRFPPVF